MARKPTPEEELAALARLLSHPVRVRILDLMHDREASASDLTPELGAPIATVAYHMRLLADGGALELRSITPVRGALERTYGLVPGVRAELDGLRAWLGKRTSGRRARST